MIWLGPSQLGWIRLNVGVNQREKSTLTARELSIQVQIPSDRPETPNRLYAYPFFAEGAMSKYVIGLFDKLISHFHFCQDAYPPVPLFFPTT